MIILGNYMLTKNGFTQSFSAMSIALIGFMMMLFYYKNAKSGWIYNLRSELINKEK